MSISGDHDLCLFWRHSLPCKVKLEPSKTKCLGSGNLGWCRRGTKLVQFAFPRSGHSPVICPLMCHLSYLSCLYRGTGAAKGRLTPNTGGRGCRPWSPGAGGERTKTGPRVGAGRARRRGPGPVCIQVPGICSATLVFSLRPGWEVALCHPGLTQTRYSQLTLFTSRSYFALLFFTLKRVSKILISISIFLAVKSWIPNLLL